MWNLGSPETRRADTGRTYLNEERRLDVSVWPWNLFEFFQEYTLSSISGYVLGFMSKTQCLYEHVPVRSFGGIVLAMVSNLFEKVVNSQCLHKSSDPKQNVSVYMLG